MLPHNKPAALHVEMHPSMPRRSCMLATPSQRSALHPPALTMLMSTILRSADS